MRRATDNQYRPIFLLAALVLPYMKSHRRHLRGRIDADRPEIQPPSTTLHAPCRSCQDVASSPGSKSSWFYSLLPWSYGYWSKGTHGWNIHHSNTHSEERILICLEFHGGKVNKSNWSCLRCAITVGIKTSYVRSTGELQSLYPRFITVINNCREANLARAIAFEGANTRLKRVIRKAQRGERIKIGILGGSVTDGHGVFGKDREKLWPNLYANWWRKTFPQVEVELINGAIPATSSSYYMSCFGEHIDRDVDIVVIELAINDQRWALVVSVGES